MNQIGSLYQVKNYQWLIFPTKELAEAEKEGPKSSASSVQWAKLYSKKWNLNVFVLYKHDLFVLLEVDGAIKKLLTHKGEIGWIWFLENQNDEDIFCLVTET